MAEPEHGVIAGYRNARFQALKTGGRFSYGSPLAFRRRRRRFKRIFSRLLGPVVNHGHKPFFNSPYRLRTAVRLPPLAQWPSDLYRKAGHDHSESSAASSSGLACMIGDNFKREGNMRLADLIEMELPSPELQTLSAGLPTRKGRPGAEQKFHP